MTWPQSFERTRILAMVAALLAASPSAAAAAQLTPAARRARAEYRHAQEAYGAAQYRDAARGFERCYGLDPRPAFLLNAAQAWRLAGRPRRALRYYRRYLGTADASPVHDQVRKLIAALEVQIDQEPVARPTKPVHPAVAVDDVERGKSRSREAVTLPLYKRWWFWTAIAAATVAVVGVSAGIASSSGPDYVKEGSLGIVRW